MPGDALGRLGRATRFASDDGELWRIDDERIARRLAALGRSGVGGFVDAGVDTTGPWARRRAPSRRLDAHAAAIPWREALAIVRGVARALEACERTGLFPGPLCPSAIGIAPDVGIAADALIAALVGATPEERRDSSPSALWTPPEQAAGRAWDAAANRYVLGLVAYRLLAGAHPFDGAGLRHALAEHRGGAPPFADAIARTLRPGVQSFVLGLLRPEAAERPSSAASIVLRCDALLADAPEPLRRASAPSSQPVRPSRRTRAQRRPVAPWDLARVRPWIPAALGLALLVPLGLTSGAPAEAPRPAVRPIAPLTTAAAASCAPCHAREVAEWERSVMAQSAASPLFGALESIVEEQVGRDARCPNGAGILRRAGADVCRDETSALTTTGSGGEHWCVNCHAPAEKLGAAMPAWSALGASRGRAPARDLLPRLALEGIACAACHQTIGPVGAHGARASAYEGNATWTSFVTGATFGARPEDARGERGIGNSGYLLDPAIFLGATGARVHRAPPAATRDYLGSSEMCGACHDVRLFGTDAIGVRARGEHFKRLRNAYSEWRAWSEAEARRGRSAPSCQGCHMSLYPGVCADGGGGGEGCPSGTHFVPRAPGVRPRGRIATSSSDAGDVASHYFTSVDVPLVDRFPDAFVDDASLDAAGLPVGLAARRDLLLSHTFRFAIGDARRRGDALDVPILIENVGAGHRVPAGFSQEREIWVAMTVRDARGGVVYDVGALRSTDEDLRDKRFLRINVREDRADARGRPLGVFGADVTDGPDVPAWSPSPALGGTTFRGRGLITLQNGFFRCVRCIGRIDGDGRCQPTGDQGRTRADRFEDAPYDLDTGECRSNLSDGNELFETYFPVGALDADRGIAKGPDAILDTRSAPPGVPLTYTYALDVRGRPGPFRIEAQLRFRSFPPYLVRAFAAYEAQKNAEGARPGGAQVDERVLRRIQPLTIARAEASVR